MVGRRPPRQPGRRARPCRPMRRQPVRRRPPQTPRTPLARAHPIPSRLPPRSGGHVCDCQPDCVRVLLERQPVRVCRLLGRGERHWSLQRHQRRRRAPRLPLAASSALASPCQPMQAHASPCPPMRALCEHLPAHASICPPMRALCEHLPARVTCSAPPPGPKQQRSLHAHVHACPSRRASPGAGKVNDLKPECQAILSNSTYFT
jgi:hypothetical protein